MTRKEVADILNELDQVYPVEEWKVDNVHIWPNVKNDLLFRWFFMTHPNDIKNYKKPIKRTRSSKIKQAIRSLYLLVKLLISRKRKASVFLAGNNSFRVEIEGNFINRYFQPLIDYVEKDLKQNVAVIDYQPQDHTKKYKPKNDFFFLHDYRTAISILRKLRTRKPVIALPDLDDFLVSLKNKLNIQFTKTEFEAYVLRKARQVQLNAAVFDIFLKKYNPKLVIGLVYYEGPMYGLNYSAHKKKIPCVDMQHGGQGPFHVAYNKFLRIPFNGYNILPEIFWCWDKDSAEIISGWTKSQSFHKVVVGGNPWLSYSETLHKKYKFPDKKIILYTLQFNELEDYLIEAIRRTPDSYSWWLRLHPRKLAGLPQLLDVLKTNDILNKVEFENATNYPLPVILSQAYVHLSKFSGSVIESVQMGVKTIIIDPVGVSVYKHYIENGQAISCPGESANLLWEAIEKATDRKKFSNEEKYNYRKVLNDLLSN